MTIIAFNYSHAVVTHTNSVAELDLQRKSELPNFGKLDFATQVILFWHREREGDRPVCNKMQILMVIWIVSSLCSLCNTHKIISG